MELEEIPANTKSELQSVVAAVSTASLNGTGGNFSESLDPHPQLSSHEAAALLCIGVLGVCMNLLVLVAIVSNRKTRKRVTNVFVTSLCLTQLLVSGLVLPTFCFSVTAQAHEHLAALAIMSYVTNLCATTHERYIAVKNSLRYNELMHHLAAMKIVIGCWVTSFVMQVLPLTWMESSHAPKIHKSYLVFILVVFLILPLVYLVYAYSCIYVAVRQLLKREKRLSICLVPRRMEYAHSASDASPNGFSQVEQIQESQITSVSVPIHVEPKYVKPRTAIKVTTVFAVITVTYLVTWLPVIYMTFLEVVERKDMEPKMLKLASAFMIGVNSIIDPAIYGLCLQDVRTRIVSILCRKKTG